MTATIAPPAPPHAPARVLRCIAACLLAILATPATAARDSVAPAIALVRQMYASYAWEAVMARPDRTPLFDESAAVLRRYFDHALTGLVLSNQACERRTREVCRLDMMPLWDSSDPGAVDLQVDGTPTPGEVQVRFHRPGDSAWTVIRFDCVATRDGLRIHDIIYADGTRLRRRLAPDTRDAP